MELADEQIKDLLGWFINESDSIEEWGEKRRLGTEENHKWIQPDVIRAMADEELKIKFLNYFNSNGGNKQAFNALNRDRIIRDIDKFRRTIYYLLDESISIKERVNQVLKGDYKISGLGRGLMAAFLNDFKPEKYCIWNNSTEIGLDVLGWKNDIQGDNLGMKYQVVLELLNKMRNLRPDLNLTLDNIDQFLFVISAEDEGKEKVKEKLTGLTDIEKLCALLEKGVEGFRGNLSRQTWLSEIQPITQPFLAAVNSKLTSLISERKDLQDFLSLEDEEVLKLGDYAGKATDMPDYLHFASRKIPIRIHNREIQIGVYVGPATKAGEKEYMHSICWGARFWGKKEAANEAFELFQDIVEGSWDINTGSYINFPGVQAFCYNSKNYAEIRQENAESLIQNITCDLIALLTNFEQYIGPIIVNGKKDMVTLLLETKKQIILYGPPGTGKTYSTKRIALGLIANRVKNNRGQKISRKESNVEQNIEKPPDINTELLREQLTNLYTEDKSLVSAARSFLHKLLVEKFKQHSKFYRNVASYGDSPLWIEQGGNKWSFGANWEGYRGLITGVQLRLPTPALSSAAVFICFRCFTVQGANEYLDSHWKKAIPGIEQLKKAYPTLEILDESKANKQAKIDFHEYNTKNITEKDLDNLVQILALFFDTMDPFYSSK